jgi:hypothetical protein
LPPGLGGAGGGARPGGGLGGLGGVGTQPVHGAPAGIAYAVAGHDGSSVPSSKAFTRFVQAPGAGAPPPPKPFENDSRPGPSYVCHGCGAQAEHWKANCPLGGARRVGSMLGGGADDVEGGAPKLKESVNASLFAPRAGRFDARAAAALGGAAAGGGGEGGGATVLSGVAPVATLRAAQGTRPTGAVGVDDV